MEIMEKKKKKKEIHTERCILYIPRS